MSMWKGPKKAIKQIILVCVCAIHLSHQILGHERSPESKPIAECRVNADDAAVGEEPDGSCVLGDRDSLHWCEQSALVWTKHTEE